MNHPVIGPLTVWEESLLPTKFEKFNNGQVQGLAWITGTDIEIGMVVSNEPGTGQFREFVRQLKESYRFIRFWAVLSPQLCETLLRYGFTAGKDIDEFGEATQVMDWVKS